MTYPLEKGDWIKFKKNNQTIAFNVLCVKEEEEMYPVYISKHNSKHEKQVNFLVISNVERWHYFAVINLSSLLRGLTSRP